MPLLENFWLFLPALVANAFPTAANLKALGKLRNYPLDFGRNFPDGRRILGDGKTFLGTVLGISGGTLFGALQGNLLLGLALSTGAIAGDIVAAFFKRRLGLPRGKEFFPVDQLDLVAGAFLLTIPFGLFSPTFSDAVLIALLAIPVHRVACILGHALKLKKEPW